MIGLQGGEVIGVFHSDLEGFKASTLSVFELVGSLHKKSGKKPASALPYKA